MATLYITEYVSIGREAGVAVASAYGAPIAQQTVAISGSSTPSATFNPGTILIRLHCDVICSINIGVNPIATTSMARMAASQTEYFAVPNTGTMSVAVISNV